MTSVHLLGFVPVPTVDRLECHCSVRVNEVRKVVDSSRTFHPRGGGGRGTTRFSSYRDGPDPDPGPDPVVESKVLKEGGTREGDVSREEVGGTDVKGVLVF